MPKENWSQLRESQVNKMHSLIGSLVDNYNQAFTGGSSIKKQNEMIEAILQTLSDLQASVLAVREYNAKMLIQHQVDLKLRQFKALQASYTQMTQAMNTMQNAMSLGAGSEDLIDNNSGQDLSELPSDHEFDDYAEKGKTDQRNFSQFVDSKEPVMDDDQVDEESAAPEDQYVVEDVGNDHNDDFDSDDVYSENESASDDSTAASAESDAYTSTTSSSANDLFTDDRISDKKAKPATGSGQRHQKSMVGQNQKTVHRVSDEEQQRKAAEAEFARHQTEAQRHPEQIKQRLKQSHQEQHHLKKSRQQNNNHRGDSSMAIKFAGSKHFVTRKGRVLDDAPREVRDVTPKKTKDDQAAIDNLLNQSL